MNTISSLVEHKELPEHELTRESRVFEGTGTSVKRRKLDQEGRLTVFKLISSLLVVLIGITGYWAAGLLW